MEDSIAEAEGIRSLFNEDEIEVCEILLNLGNLVVESELRLRTTTASPLKPPFLVRWGTQKRLICRRGGTRRGSSTTSLSPPPNNPATTLSKSSSPLQSLQNNTIGQPEVKVVGSTSPDTPLSFPANASSESDDKSSRRKKSKKRALLTEQLRKSMEGLAESREVLIKEIQNVKSYYNELLAYNKKLKAKKQQVLSTSTHPTREEPNLELGKSFNPGFNCVRSYHVLANPDQNQFNGEQMAAESIIRPALFHPYGNGQVQVRPSSFSPSTGLGEVNAVGPPDISNLRAAAAAAPEGTYGVASSQPLNYCRAFADDNRTKAAEARRNRKMINQQKTVLRLKLKGISTTVMMKPPLSRR